MTNDNNPVGKNSALAIGDGSPVLADSTSTTGVSSLMFEVSTPATGAYGSMIKDATSTINVDSLVNINHRTKTSVGGLLNPKMSFCQLVLAIWSLEIQLQRWLLVVQSSKPPFWLPIPDVQSLTSNTNNFDVEPSVLVICLKIFTYHTKHLKIFYFKTNRTLKTNK